MSSHQDIPNAVFNGRKGFGDLKTFWFQSLRIKERGTSSQNCHFTLTVRMITRGGKKKSITEEAQIPIFPLTVASIVQDAMQWQLNCAGLV